MGCGLAKGDGGLPDPFECPIVLGLASRVRECALLAQGIMISTVAGLAMSLGDVCTRIGFAVGMGTCWVLVLGARVLGVLGAAAGCWVLGSGAGIPKETVGSKTLSSPHGAVPESLRTQLCGMQATTWWKSDYEHAECYSKWNQDPQHHPGSPAPSSHYHNGIITSVILTQ